MYSPILVVSKINNLCCSFNLSRLADFAFARMTKNYVTVFIFPFKHYAILHPIENMLFVNSSRTYRGGFRESAKGARKDLIRKTL